MPACASMRLGARCRLGIRCIPRVLPYYGISNRADSLLRFLSFSVERAAVDAVLYTHTHNTHEWMAVLSAETPLPALCATPCIPCPLLLRAHPFPLRMCTYDLFLCTPNALYMYI